LYNVTSLYSGTKREELLMIIEKKIADIVGITETWGRNNILDSEMGKPGFRLYRKDRVLTDDKEGGGGVALYVSNRLLVLECTKLNSMSYESVWCKIFTDELNYYIVGVCYRCPDANEIETNNLFQCINAAANENQPILIMEDFNYPGIN